MHASISWSSFLTWTFCKTIYHFSFHVSVIQYIVLSLSLNSYKELVVHIWLNAKKFKWNINEEINDGYVLIRIHLCFWYQLSPLPKLLDAKKKSVNLKSHLVTTSVIQQHIPNCLWGAFGFFWFVNIIFWHFLQTQFKEIIFSPPALCFLLYPYVCVTALKQSVISYLNETVLSDNITIIEFFILIKYEKTYPISIPLAADISAR